MAHLKPKTRSHERGSIMRPVGQAIELSIISVISVEAGFNNEGVSYAILDSYWVKINSEYSLIRPKMYSDYL